VGHAALMERSEILTQFWSVTGKKVRLQCHLNVKIKITPRTSVLEKLIFLYVVNTLATSHGTECCIFAVATARHFSVS
jgi:hypothetical protein